MKKLIALEELAMLGVSIAALYYLGVPWWSYLLLAIGPDISFLGYLGGNKVGAITYNIFHHKGLAAALILIGFFMAHDELTMAGIILFGHSSMDRMLGYGLKHFDGFKYTHLGQIGKR